jgi:hypothetical protein
MPVWLRVFLLINVVQDFAIGFGLIAPAHIVVPLKGLTPLNARFIAALYLGGGVTILLAALSAARWTRGSRCTRSASSRCWSS